MIKVKGKCAKLIIRERSLNCVKNVSSMNFSSNQDCT